MHIPSTDTFESAMEQVLVSSQDELGMEERFRLDACWLKTARCARHAWDCRDRPMGSAGSSDGRVYRALT